MTASDWLASHAEHTRDELGKAILNRHAWDRLREELRLCEFLQARLPVGADFPRLRRELAEIVAGTVRVPTLPNPRRTAADCLERWAAALAAAGDAPAPAAADPA